MNKVKKSAYNKSEEKSVGFKVTINMSSLNRLLFLLSSDSPGD